MEKLKEFQLLDGPLHTRGAAKKDDLAQHAIDRFFLLPQVSLLTSICSQKHRSAFHSKWKTHASLSIGQQMLEVYNKYGYSAQREVYPNLHQNLPFLQQFFEVVSPLEITPRKDQLFSMPNCFKALVVWIEKKECVAVGEFYKLSSRKDPNDFGTDQTILFDCDSLGLKDVTILEVSAFCSLISSECCILTGRSTACNIAF
jgi:hypothetical protein